MFLTPLDEVIKRLGGEVTFLEQLVAKYREELDKAKEELKEARDQIVDLNKELIRKVNEEIENGH